ncbi:MAG: PAS domain S-box protein, partial [Planctomycetota bacterium]
MLDGVKVPKEFEPVFKKAEEYVSKYFSERRENPSEGTIEIFGQRYIFVRAAAMSVEFFDIIKSLYGDKGEREAMAIARSLLYDIAHAIGIADAREFHRRMDLKDPIEKLSAGPLHFSHSGWAFVDIFPESRPTPDEEYYLIYDHPYSFESDAWIKAGRHAEFPVCVMNAGYSSGWCEESFGVPLVATEILCRAEGDDCCRFVMAHPSKIEKYIREYVKKKPELGRRIKNYEIPGFFSRKKAEEELRKNEEKFRNLAEEITDGVIVTVDHETRWINKAYCEIFGYEKQELLGKGPEFFLLPEEVPGIKRIVEDMLAGIEVPATYEALARRKDGEIIVIEFSGKAITYEGKKATQVVIRDVTKRKRDEEKLIMLRNLVDESNDALFVIDIEEGRFLDANMKACKNLGYSREELRGMNVRDVEVILPDQPSWEEHVKQLSEYGQLIIEGKHRRKGGTTFPVEASVSLISHQGRDFIVAVARDITERKRAEEAIRKSEERWRSLVENAPNIIIIQDREGTILFINRTVPGLSVEDTLGSKVYEYIPTEYHKLVRETTEKVFETGESGQYEIAGVGPHGRTSWYHTQLGPIMQDGEVVAVTLITTDVTERKRGERELVRVMKAVEGASDAIAMADPAGDHIYQNKAFSELFEYQTTEELD